MGLLLLLKLLLLECVVAALFMRSWVARVGEMMTATLARGKTWKRGAWKTLRRGDASLPSKPSRFAKSFPQCAFPGLLK